MAKKKKTNKSGFKRLFFWGLLPALVLAGLVLGSSIRSVNRESDRWVKETALLGEFDPEAKIAYFQNELRHFDFEEIFPTSQSLAFKKGAVLGTSAPERWVEVDLSEQRLFAYEGDQLVWDFAVSTGKWAKTPTGDFRVWLKLKYTKMSGGSKEKRTYYYLPNVPYVMYFYQGYGLHGTYWHQNFGEPMSHGCVNMATPEVEKIFYWSSPVLPPGKKSVRATKDNPGMRVVIHD
ncbi:MAG: L,D-transpeptidase [Candidatus Pacebacteria bacterium]|nr:L,D-transpeptidase [Candidatus Paceibacterota bacterium]